jgi:hypothetical protein
MFLPVLGNHSFVFCRFPRRVTIEKLFCDQPSGRRADLARLCDAIHLYLGSRHLLLDQTADDLVKCAVRIFSAVKPAGLDNRRCYAVSSFQGRPRFDSVLLTNAGTDFPVYLRLVLVFELFFGEDASQPIPLVFGQCYRSADDENVVHPLLSLPVVILADDYCVFDAACVGQLVGDLPDLSDPTKCRIFLDSSVGKKL